MRKYKSINRMKDRYTNAFTVGENITISEKVDGANASIQYDSENKMLIANSRRRTLDEMNTLSGFWTYVQTLNVKAFSTVFSERYILYGEWGCKHTVKYPSHVRTTFFVFDVFDTEKEVYLPHIEVVRMLDECEIKFHRVPIFYEGTFISWEHCYSFVGKTALEAEPCGEGVVVKSQDRLNDPVQSRTPRYVKLISSQFSETKCDKKKEVDLDALAAREVEEEKVAQIVTQRRVEKILQCFIEDGLIPEDWDSEHMKTIAKNLPKYVYEDCKKEEPEFLLECTNFGRISASLSMKIARKILNEKFQNTLTFTN